MEKCKKIREFLGKDQLNEKESLLVKAHINECSLCSKEAYFLKETWDLLGIWKGIRPSSNFKERFWQRAQQEEKPLKEKVFVFPRLLPRFVPVFGSLAAILIIGVYLVFFSLKRDKNLQMFKELELVEEFGIIQNINILEDFEIINFIEL